MVTKSSSRLQSNPFLFLFLFLIIVPFLVFGFIGLSTSPPLRERIPVECWPENNDGSCLVEPIGAGGYVIYGILYTVDQLRHLLNV